jgi:hypothetical protein
MTSVTEAGTAAPAVVHAQIDPHPINASTARRNTLTRQALKGIDFLN